MKKTILLFLALFFIQISIAQTTYILCGKIIDTKSGKTNTKKTILIKNEKIIDLVDGYLMPKGAKIIDLRSKVVMPGLIDMHVHIEQEYDGNTRINSYILNEADIAFKAVGYAKTTLLNGFTSVRDLGGTGVNISLKKAIKAGAVPGPRVFTAGKSLATTGGHADPTNGSSRKLIGDPGPKEGVVNSVEDAKKAVRQRYKNGADWIKITATGGVLSVAKSGDNPQFTIEEVKAICETAWR
jgi:imidazolonepropionase-like amidohydrolase